MDVLVLTQNIQPESTLGNIDFSALEQRPLPPYDSAYMLMCNKFLKTWKKPKLIFLK